MFFIFLLTNSVSFVFCSCGSGADSGIEANDYIKIYLGMIRLCVIISFNWGY